MPTVTASERRKAEYEACSPAKKKEWDRCGVPAKKSGKPCWLVAGSGTDHFGEGRCYRHEAAQDMRAPIKRVMHDTFSMGKAIRTDPAKAMQFVLDITFGQLVYAYWKVTLLDEDEYWITPSSGGNAYLNKHIRHLSQLKDETVRYAKAAGDLGIAERMASLAEGQAQLITKFMDSVMADLDLTERQKKKLGPAIREHTKMLVEHNQGPDVIEILSQDGEIVDETRVVRK